MVRRKVNSKRKTRNQKVWPGFIKRHAALLLSVCAVGIIGVAMVFRSFAVVEPVGISGNWGLVFDDEFNGTSLNSKYWNPDWFNGGKVNSEGVTMSAANQSVSGGNLILTLASSSSGATVDTDPSQTNGGGFQFGTGYVAEARMYIPGSGSTIYNWPAFWTDGQNWPTDGESDIFEGLGTATSNYHSPQGANNSGTIPGTWSNGWHTYALYRAAGKDYIYWDGKLVRSYTPDDGGSPQYLIFSLDCSGGCKTGSAYQEKVDYVRVWKAGAGAPTPSPSPSPNPTHRPSPTPSPVASPGHGSAPAANTGTNSPASSSSGKSSTSPSSSPATTPAPAGSTGTNPGSNTTAGGTETHKSTLSKLQLSLLVGIPVIIGLVAWRILVRRYRKKV